MLQAVPAITDSSQAPPKCAKGRLAVWLRLSTTPGAVELFGAVVVAVSELCLSHCATRAPLSAHREPGAPINKQQLTAGEEIY